MKETFKYEYNTYIEEMFRKRIIQDSATKSEKFRDLGDNNIYYYRKKCGGLRRIISNNLEKYHLHGRGPRSKSKKSEVRF